MNFSNPMHPMNPMNPISPLSPVWHDVEAVDPPNCMDRGIAHCERQEKIADFLLVSTLVCMAIGLAYLLWIIRKNKE